MPFWQYVLNKYMPKWQCSSCDYMPKRYNETEVTNMMLRQLINGNPSMSKMLQEI